MVETGERRMTDSRAKMVGMGRWVRGGLKRDYFSHDDGFL
jgi:hypothetical protein